MLETNLDDISAEILGHFLEVALAAGALDVYHTPVQMKKNRPGVLLTVLCAAGFGRGQILRNDFARNQRPSACSRTIAERRKLQREFVKVKTPYGDVTVKLGRY